MFILYLYSDRSNLGGESFSSTTSILTTASDSEESLGLPLSDTLTLKSKRPCDS